MRQMQKFALFLAGTFVMAGGVLVVACGTDNGSSSSGALPTPDTGKPSSSGNSSGASSGGQDGSSSGSSGDPDGGADADCSRAARLHNAMEAGAFYCPFKAADGGNSGPCTIDQTCCNPNAKLADGGFNGSYCATSPVATKTGAGSNQTFCQAGAAAASSDWAEAGTAWECADKNNCAAGQSCWLVGDGVNVGAASTGSGIPKACNAKQGYKFTGTVCSAAQPVPGAMQAIKLCSPDDMNCGAGTTCTPFLALSRDLATCL